MRILYLADIRFPLERANGIQSMETCYALASRGHMVTMAVRPDTAAPSRDPFDFYGLRRLETLSIERAAVTGPATARRVGYLTFALGRSLGRARQDLVFTRDLAIASLLARVPVSMRTPLVYEAHGLAAETAAALPRLVTGAPAPSNAKVRRLAARDARVWRHADGYVTITAGLKNELERRFGVRGHVAVVPDGVRLPFSEQDPVPPSVLRPPSSPDDDAVPSSVLRPPSSFTIGYAGHLYPWKGVDLVVEAVAGLPDVHGLIIGGHEREPDLERVRAMAQQLYCSSRITFTGMLRPREVGARLSEADVLVLPNPPSALSRDFTSPLKLFEYMAAGRPIVASDLPSIREVLTDGRNAVLFEAGNPQALTAAIRRLKDDPELGRRLAAGALADVREYTWARRAEKLEALFTSLAGLRP